jgi:hypothetical protein
MGRARSFAPLEKARGFRMTSKTNLKRSLRASLDWPDEGVRRYVFLAGYFGFEAAIPLAIEDSRETYN